MPDRSAVQAMRVWNPGVVSTASTKAARLARMSPNFSPAAPPGAGKEIYGAPLNADSNGTREWKRCDALDPRTNGTAGKRSHDAITAVTNDTSGKENFPSRKGDTRGAPPVCNGDYARNASVIGAPGTKSDAPNANASSTAVTNSHPPTPHTNSTARNGSGTQNDNTTATAENNISPQFLDTNTRGTGSGSPIGGARGRSRIRSTVPPLRLLSAVAALPPIIDVHARLQGSLVSTISPRLALTPYDGGGAGMGRTSAGRVGDGMETGVGIGGKVVGGVRGVVGVSASGVAVGGVGGGVGRAGGKAVEEARLSPRGVELSVVERLASHYSPAAQGLFVDPSHGGVGWRQKDKNSYAKIGDGDCCFLLSHGATVLSPRRGKSLAKPGVRGEVLNGRRAVSAVSAYGSEKVDWKVVSAVSADASERKQGARRAITAPSAPRGDSRGCRRITLPDKNDPPPPAKAGRFMDDDNAVSVNQIRAGGNTPDCILAPSGSARAQGNPGSGEARKNISRREDGHNGGTITPLNETGHSSQGEGFRSRCAGGTRPAVSWAEHGVGMPVDFPLAMSPKLRIPLDGEQTATQRCPPIMPPFCGSGGPSKCLSSGKRWCYSSPNELGMVRSFCLFESSGGWSKN